MVEDQEYATLAQLRYTFRRFLRFSEQAAQTAGVTPQQHQALLAIRAARGPFSVGDLAEQLQLRHNSTAGLVDRLERQGLLSRTVDPHDRRRVLLQLTEPGNSILERLTEAHRAELRRLGPGLRQLLLSLEGLEEA